MLAIDPAVAWTAHDTWLVVCAASGVAAVVVLVAAARVHPFLALVLGSGWVGLAAGMRADGVLAAFQKGAGETLGGVGLVLALGAMLGKLLATSGGADRIATAILSRTRDANLPWAMALAATLVGLPLFFEVGLVLLMPIVQVLSRRSGVPILRLGVPALAALSVCHGLIPPHPGPLVAAGALGADVGRMLAYGLVVAVPTVAIAGPLFGAFCARRVHPSLPPTLLAPSGDAPAPTPPAHLPGLGATLGTLLLPIALMLGRSAVELSGGHGRGARAVAALGHPVAAMLVSVLVATWTLGRACGRSRREIERLLGEGLSSIGAMLLVIAAGGGLKQTLIDSGVGGAIGAAAQRSSTPALLLGWLLAAAVRVATGSATVATVTASGILAPIAPTLHEVSRPLLALAVGSGSLFFSHVNDAGFWLVKEYFGMSLGETFQSWSVMETIVSIVALAGTVALAVWIA